MFRRVFKHLKFFLPFKLTKALENEMNLNRSFNQGLLFRKKVYLGLFFLIAPFLTVSVIFANETVKKQADQFHNFTEVTLKNYPNQGGDFSLIGPSGKRVFSKTYRGKVILLFFGYRFCPDVCPLTIWELKSVLDKLGDDAESVQVVFVSVDPERDSPKNINEEWLGFYDGRIL